LAPPQPVLPQPLPPAVILSASQSPSVVANKPPPKGTDPTRATLIDQIGALQMQLVLARLKRELAQTQAETAKLAPDLAGEASGVEALLDRMAERDGRGARGPAVQAVFGRDGEWAARLLLPGEGSRVVRSGDLLADRWRVESIDERSVVLVALHGDARQVLRPGIGTPRADEFDSEVPIPAARPAKAAAAPAASQEAAIAQAPVAAQMLRPR
jgi:type IV pilus biogenesis protein PilP